MSMTAVADDAPAPDEPATRPAAQPADVAAERVVLGAMMLNAEAVHEVSERLEPDDYYAPTHPIIHRAILDLFGDRKPCTEVAVAALLAERGDLGRIGGAGYLHDCSAAVPTVANAGYYAGIVAERAQRRRLIVAGTRIAQLGYQTGTEDPDAPLADRASQLLYDATVNREWRRTPTFNELVERVITNCERGPDDPDGAGTVPTGFHELDRLLGGGLRDGQLVVVAGRPGQGKSVLGVDILRHTAVRRREPALFFTLEMSALELTERFLSAEAGVPLDAIRSRNIEDSHHTKLTRLQIDLLDAPVELEEHPRTTLLDIRARARRMKATTGLRLIVVDYVQLMKIATRRAYNREQEVAELSRGLKLLAKEVECPVIAMCQLNRGPESRSDKQPMLSDLRESGAIEQDADVVILLFRPDYYEKECPRPNEVDFIVAKNRSGPTDTVPAFADLAHARFRDLYLPDRQTAPPSW